MTKEPGPEAGRADLSRDREGLALVRNTARGALRIIETLSVVGRQGAGWLLGDRDALPRRLRHTFESLGATYIKLGQFIASSPSLFPEEYVQEFQKCLDRTPPMPFHYIREMVESELGKPLAEAFEWVDPQPLASASIAQVHAARLHNGAEVVIKVQRPGVRNVLLTDFNFLYVSARVIESLAPGLSRSALSGVVEELQAGGNLAGKRSGDGQLVFGVELESREERGGVEHREGSDLVNGLVSDTDAARFGSEPCAAAVRARPTVC